MSMTNYDYRDLGLIIDGGAVAAGAVVYSNYFDDMGWVRNMALFIANDQSVDVMLTRRDQSGAADYSTQLKAASPATGGSNNWVSYVVPPVSGNSITTNGAVVGYSFRLGLKNVGASPTTYAKLKAQLMGI